MQFSIDTHIQYIIDIHISASCRLAKAFLIHSWRSQYNKRSEEKHNMDFRSQPSTWWEWFTWRVPSWYCVWKVVAAIAMGDCEQVALSRRSRCAPITTQDNTRTTSPDTLQQIPRNVLNHPACRHIAPSQNNVSSDTRTVAGFKL